jgi:hypothetical protein
LRHRNALFQRSLDGRHFASGSRAETCRDFPNNQDLRDEKSTHARNTILTYRGLYEREEKKQVPLTFGGWGVHNVTGKIVGGVLFRSQYQRGRVGLPHWEAKRGKVDTNV